MKRDPRGYYRTLNVDQNATKDEIDKAYRKKAKGCHPDTHPNDEAAAEAFKELTEAHRVLSDPKRREAYDTTGESDTLPRAEDMAVKFISEGVNVIVHQGIDTLTYNDFLAELTAGLKKIQQNIDNDLVKIADVIEKLTYMETHIKNGKDEENSLSAMIRQQRDEAAREQAIAQIAESAAAIALDKISHYQFKKRPMPASVKRKLAEQKKAQANRNPFAEILGMMG